MKWFRLGFPIFGHQPPELAMMNYPKGRSHVEEEKGVLAQCHNKHFGHKTWHGKSHNGSTPLKKVAPATALRGPRVCHLMEGGRRQEAPIHAWNFGMAAFPCTVLVAIHPAHKKMARKDPTVAFTLNFPEFWAFCRNLCFRAFVVQAHFFSTSPSWVHTESNRANQFFLSMRFASTVCIQNTGFSCKNLVVASGRTR